MRAPEEKFIGYSERQWQEIKRVLARASVDADSVQIGQRSLRGELDRLAEQYAENSQQKILTSKQLYHVIDEAIDAVVSFRDVFGPRTTATYFAGDALAAEAREVLDRLEAKLRSATVTDEARDSPEIIQEGAEMVMRPGGGPSKNARKEARDHYWSRLAKIWQSIVPPTTSRQRLIDFLVACTGASKPAVRSYFDRKHITRSG